MIKRIKKELYEIEKRKELYDRLVKLVNTLNTKEKYKHHDHDDLDYYGIRDRKFI